MGEDDEVPRDAKLVRSILRSMGVEHHEPRVVNQFLDLWYRYVVDVLGDAQTYSEHAGKPSIDRDDVKLAIQSRVNFSFSQPPPREYPLERFLKWKKRKKTKWNGKKVMETTPKPTTTLPPKM